MNDIVDMGSGDMISFIKTGSGPAKLIGRDTHTDTQTQRAR
jgi:hypothetical protein